MWSYCDLLFRSLSKAFCVRGKCGLCRVGRLGFNFFVVVLIIFTRAHAAVMALLFAQLTARGALVLRIGLNVFHTVRAEVMVTAPAFRQHVGFAEGTITVSTDPEGTSVAENLGVFGFAVGAEFHLVLVGS